MIDIGTCSWTEKTLIQSGEFYPKEVKTAETRLRYYASAFSTVEVDSTYYAIPDARNAALWADRTPEGFVFHIKAYGALTGHGIDTRTLPGDIASLLPRKEKGQVYIREPEILKVIAERFREALLPLTKAGKLGLLVFQFPPWFDYRTSRLDALLERKELMQGLPVAVEFRHGSWLTPGRQEGVFTFLSRHGLTYVAADEPQYGDVSTIPFVPRVTTDTAYIRLHGRNRENWLKKGIETTLRFAYEYSADELRTFLPSVKKMAGEARTAYVMFNNCHLGFAVKNAFVMKALLKEKSEGGVIR
ncbi:MAG TPA: DUF72 domain-containing protein [Thermodesulfovibrionales bacterium]|nr:DUF72 domain-containing protein [Thermodesulfovibrionales bacterium]